MEQIPLPSKIEINKKGENRAQFVFEPLYPGYGTTIGNALRRVLLSSLPGAAVQAVKIKGVDHEFSTIHHVKDDIVGIILNLKQLRFKFYGKEPIKLNLKVKGEKNVTGSDIKTTSEVEVVNKKQRITTLTNKNASLEMEITVGPGRGYVPVEAREKEIHEIGTIVIDAIYTPVRNVNFNIENVRVEQMTNYERLILDITTDGTITPEESLKLASEILVEHFNFVKALKETKPKAKTLKEVKAKAPEKEKKEEEESASATSSVSDSAKATSDKKTSEVKKATADKEEKEVKKKRGRPKKTES